MEDLLIICVLNLDESVKMTTCQAGVSVQRRVLVQLETGRSRSPSPRGVPMPSLHSAFRGRRYPGSTLAGPPHFTPGLRELSPPGPLLPASAPPPARPGIRARPRSRPAPRTLRKPPTAARALPLRRAFESLTMYPRHEPFVMPVS